MPFDPQRVRVSVQRFGYLCQERIGGGPDDCAPRVEEARLLQTDNQPAARYIHAHLVLNRVFDQVRLYGSLHFTKILFLGACPASVKVGLSPLANHFRSRVGFQSRHDVELGGLNNVWLAARGCFGVAE